MLYISDFNLRVVLIGGSLGSFIWSTGAVSRAMLNRSEDFSEIAKIGVFSSILYFISSVSLANLQGSGTLALIGGQVISIFGTSFLTIRASKLKVRFSLPRRVNVEAVHFFKNTGISGFSNFLARNLDSVLIYISLGVTSLAFYDRAYIIVLNIQLALSQIFSRVFLPKFATHSGDLAAKYLSGLKIYAQFSMFLSTISILFSDRIVTTLLSNGYESTASLLPILAFGGFLQSLSSLSGVLLLSKRRTSTLLKISGISALVYATAFLSVFLFSTSLLHYAFATCISALVVLMIVMIYLPSTVDNLTLSNQLKCVLPSLATVAVSFALSSYLNQH
jgi:PST family polysaccharide transporter